MQTYSSINMPHSIILLQNGIKLVHQEVNSPIAHFGVLVNAGTRDEPDSLMGLAHFIEHTIFKGTKKRKGFQILKRLEDVGGELNASTSKEETYFHASFLHQDYPRTLELLADILFNATFPEKEIEKEKDVIIEEINYYKDTPIEFLFDDFETVIFQNHQLARNILGTKSTIAKIKQKDIIAFIHRHYTPENMVLSSIGNIATPKLVKMCNNYFAALKYQHDELPKRVPFTDYKPQFVKRNKKNAQAHILLGNLAYPYKSEKKYPFLLLSNLIGGPGMSTRLNMMLREKKGLGYSVEANYSTFSDTGLFTVYIGCDHNEVDKCIELTYKELEKIRTNKLGVLQLQYAKKQLIGQIAIAGESKLAEMLANGRSALHGDEVETIDETIQRIENVTANEILQVANEILQKEQFSMLLYAKNV